MEMPMQLSSIRGDRFVGEEVRLLTQIFRSIQNISNSLGLALAVSSGGWLQTTESGTHWLPCAETSAIED
jgi:hypothetical protein